MADSNLERQRRYRYHQKGDHSLCKSGCDTKTVAPSVLPGVQAALEAAGRADTYLGMAAITLAARLDGSIGIQGLPAMVKELRETMDRALAGTQKAGKLLEMRHGRRGLRGSETVDGAAS